VLVVLQILLLPSVWNLRPKVNFRKMTLNPCDLRNSRVDDVFSDFDS
jgi:hypothetical protein